MRIWLAPSAFFPSRGGVEELTIQLAQEYQRRGHEVTVVVHRNPADLPTRDMVEGVPVARIAFDLPGRDVGRILKAPRAMARQVNDLRVVGPTPDVLHIQCAANQVPAVAIFARRYRIPLILTTQGEVTMDAAQIYQHSVQMRAALRLGSRLATDLTACSRRAGDDAATVAPRFRNCPVVPNGVDVRQWKVTPLPSDPIFAAWGRHVPQKGLDLLVKAFARVRDHVPNAVLRIGGDGPQTSMLKALAGDGVEFLGPLDRSGVQALLSESRVAVVPSRLEPFGIVALEAMAAGRGVVWSIHGGLRDATGGIGWPVDPHDISALARAMHTAYLEPVDTLVARAHAETKNWGAIADQYETVYMRAVQQRTADSAVGGHRSGQALT